MSDVAVPVEEKRGSKRMIILMSLSVILVGVISLGVYYFRTGSLAMLPGVGGIVRNQPPRLLYNIYGVAEPFGVALSPDGNRIYVAEQAGERQIRVFDRSGKELFTISHPDSTGSNRLPVFLATSPDGRLFVTDRVRDDLEVYSPSGQFLKSVKAPDGLWAPVGLAIDPHANKVFVGDIETSHQRVLVFDLDLNFLSSFGTMGEDPGQMDYPSGIAVGADGRIYVGQTLTQRVDIYDAGGNYVGKDMGDMSAGIPRGIAIDSLARLFLVDNVNGVVSAYDLQKKPIIKLFSFGDNPGGGEQPLTYPNGLAVDQTGRVYIADRVNNRVQVWGY